MMTRFQGSPGRDRRDIRRSFVSRRLLAWLCQANQAGAQSTNGRAEDPRGCRATGVSRAQLLDLLRRGSHTVFESRSRIRSARGIPHLDCGSGASVLVNRALHCQES
jgi:hypothetical protein